MLAQKIFIPRYLSRLLARIYNLYTFVIFSNTQSNLKTHQIENLFETNGFSY